MDVDLTADVDDSIDGENAASNAGEEVEECFDDEICILPARVKEAPLLDLTDEDKHEV